MISDAGAVCASTQSSVSEMRSARLKDGIQMETFFPVELRGANSALFKGLDHRNDRQRFSLCAKVLRPFFVGELRTLKQRRCRYFGPRLQLLHLILAKY